MSTFISAQVGGLRRAAKVPYPISFVSTDKAMKDPAYYAFNCGQRAQTNITENYGPFVISLLVSGLMFPKTAAVMGAANIISRIMYFSGYVRSPAGVGDGGRGRRVGLWGFVPHLGLQALALWTSGSMILNSQWA